MLTCLERLQIGPAIVLRAGQHLDSQFRHPSAARSTGAGARRRARNAPAILPGWSCRPRGRGECPPAPGAHPRIEWVSVHSCWFHAAGPSPWATRVTSTSPGALGRIAHKPALRRCASGYSRGPRTLRGSAFPCCRPGPRAFPRPRPGEPSPPGSSDPRNRRGAVSRSRKRCSGRPERGPRRHLIDPVAEPRRSAAHRFPQSAAHVAKRSQHRPAARVSFTTAAEGVCSMVATWSAIVTSISCPTAEITGTVHSRWRRPRFLVEGHEIFTRPAPRPRMMA